MTKKIKTIREATEEWVHEMNAVPQSMIAALMNIDGNLYDSGWKEVTMPAKYDRVCVDFGDGGEIVSVIEPTDDDDEPLYEIELYSGKTVTVPRESFDVEYEDCLPVWGTMWSFGDSCDDWWLEEDDGIRKMSECRFRIFHHDEYGYWFGIDGAGYSFYDEHWIPLYKIRGLQWHNVDE